MVQVSLQILVILTVFSILLCGGLASVAVYVVFRKFFRGP